MPEIPRVTYWLISIVILGMLITGMTSFLVKMGSIYDIDVPEQQLEKYDRIDNITTFTNQVDREVTQTNITGFQQNQIDVDIISLFFGNAYRVLILFPQTVGFMGGLLTQSMADIGISEGGIVIGGIILILTILLIVGVFLSLLLKRDLL
jgi:hypothetical protein